MDSSHFVRNTTKVARNGPQMCRRCPGLSRMMPRRCHGGVPECPARVVFSGFDRHVVHSGKSNEINGFVSISFDFCRLHWFLMVFSGLALHFTDSPEFMWFRVCCAVPAGSMRISVESMCMGSDIVVEAWWVCFVVYKA